MTTGTLRLWLAAGLSWMLLACGGSETENPGNGSCSNSSQCFWPEVCVDGMCAAHTADAGSDSGLRDSGTGTDAGPADAGNPDADGTDADATDAGGPDGGDSAVTLDAATCSGGDCGCPGAPCCSGNSCNAGSLCNNTGTCVACGGTPNGSGTVDLACRFAGLKGNGSSLEIIAPSRGDRGGCTPDSSVIGFVRMDGVTFSGEARSCGRILQLVGRGNRIELHGQRSGSPLEGCGSNGLVGTVMVTGAQVNGSVTIHCSVETVSATENKIRFEGIVRRDSGSEGWVCDGRRGVIGELTFQPANSCDS